MSDVTQCLIISQFRNLEQLGYRAMAFGFFEDDAQAASTSDCTTVLQPKFIEYIHSVTVVGSSARMYDW